MKQTDTFQMLSDETRLRALSLMACCGELCVCELVHALEIPQPKISRHLAALRDAGLVTARRDAQWMRYELNGDVARWQDAAVKAAIAAVADEPLVVADMRRLSEMKDRPQKSDAA
jgi:ArsR family transcriptional regulator